MSTDAQYGRLSDDEVFLYRHDSVVTTEIASDDFTAVGFDEGGQQPPVIIFDCSERIYEEYLEDVIEGESNIVPFDFTFELIFDYKDPQWHLALFEVTEIDRVIAYFPSEYSDSLIQSFLHHGRYSVMFSFDGVDTVPDSCSNCSDTVDIPHIELRTDFDIYPERMDFYRGMQKAIGEPVNYYISDNGDVDRLIAEEV